MICPHPDCGWPAMVQGYADSTDGEAFAMCVVLLATADVLEPGVIARACRVSTLREASLDELLAELKRRGAEA